MFNQKQKLTLTSLAKCGQGSYGKVLMAIAEELNIPLAIKKVTHISPNPSNRLKSKIWLR